MAEATATTSKKDPICVIVLGMAGSGKTSLVARLSNLPNKPYIINLDPACLQMRCTPNIDIRDTINYKEIMKQFKLGPNGAIVTSLNLFSTRFQDVLNYIKKADTDLCIFDTPGQIEVFTWSVSGTIITETLASTYPTVVLYVMDIVRSTSPITFMSNMLYACSILYKTRLPFIVVMNKIDIVSNSYAIEWMNNFETFQDALNNDDSYISNLTRSMSLTLDEFYKNLPNCGVSAATGEGIEKLCQLIEDSRITYENEYKCENEKLKQIKKEKKPVIEGKSTGIEIADIYLRQTTNDDSSSDSEGEEMNIYDNVDIINNDDNDKFQQILKQQREMQVKRLQEAQNKLNQI